MKYYTDQEIAQMRANINNGAYYCGVKCNKGGYGRIYKTLNGYIGWQHFGGSAVKNTDENLRWLIECIFNDCDEVVPAVYSKYHIAYVPIDTKYERVDLSTSHPNVWGL